MWNSTKLALIFENGTHAQPCLNIPLNWKFVMIIYIYKTLSTFCNLFVNIYLLCPVPGHLYPIAVQIESVSECLVRSNNNEAIGLIYILENEIIAAILQHYLYYNTNSTLLPNFLKPIYHSNYLDLRGRGF